MTSYDHIQAGIMFQSGEYTMQDIAQSVGVPVEIIREWRKEDEWPTPPVEPKEFSPEVRRQALNLIDDGESISAVSQALGMDRKTIYRWLEVRPSGIWRCYCVPLGVTIKGDRSCPVCGGLSPLANLGESQEAYGDSGQDVPDGVSP